MHSSCADEKTVSPVVDTAYAAGASPRAGAGQGWMMSSPIPTQPVTCCRTQTATAKKGGELRPPIHLPQPAEQTLAAQTDRANVDSCCYSARQPRKTHHSLCSEKFIQKRGELGSKPSQTCGDWPRVDSGAFRLVAACLNEAKATTSSVFLKNGYSSLPK